MSWAEVQQTAAAFRSEKAKEAARQEAEASFRKQAYNEGQQATVAALRESGQTVLTRLGVPAILEAIREEIWHEGQISLFHHIPEFHLSLTRDTKRVGLRLESDDIPTLDYQPYTDRRNPSVCVWNQRTRLETEITFREYNTPGGTLFVKEEAPIFVLVLGLEDFQDAIRKTRLSEGVRYLTQIIRPSVNRNSWGFSEKKLKDIEGTQMVRGLIANWFDETIEREKQYGQFPRQVRFQSTRLLQFLPPTLMSKGKLSAQELREWAYEVKGVNPVHRMVDRWLRNHHLAQLQI